MKKYSFILIMLISASSLLLTSCSSDQNNEYTYGTYENDDISSVYELVGTPEYRYSQLYADGVKKGVDSNLGIYVCETASGGIVAYAEGMYVYSPDKNDKNGVATALIVRYNDLHND